MWPLHFPPILLDLLLTLIFLLALIFSGKASAKQFHFVAPLVFLWIQLDSVAILHPQILVTWQNDDGNVISQ